MAPEYTDPHSTPVPASPPPDEGQRRRRARRNIIWTVLAIVAALVLVWAIARRGSEPAERFGGRQRGPLSVAVGHVARADIPLTIDALGTVTPLATVTIRAQVNGQLLKLNFKEGQMVKAGEVLAQIDPRPYQATLDQAQGQLKRDQAQLANARTDLDRYKMLLSQNSVSEQQYATQRALVSQDEALVATDKASVESASINLGYCRITSPVAGRVGLRQVDLGNLVQANSTTIVVVTQLEPISVMFTVPEDNVDSILGRVRAGVQLPLTIYDRNQEEALASGVLSTTDNQIDTTTGTLKMRGLFDNKDHALFPNQFVNVKLLLNTLHDQLVVPGAALQTGASGNFVYLVNPDNTVNMHTVSIGPVSGNLVSITQGLKVGDTVVVDGADQLRDGAEVSVPGASNATAPASGAATTGAAATGAAATDAVATGRRGRTGGRWNGRKDGKQQRGT